VALPRSLLPLSKVFVLDFKSKKIRVNLNLPIKAEVKAESTDVLKTVDEDRKYVIQATIVRCVKSHFLIANCPFTRTELQDHEGTQNDEEPASDPRGHLTNFPTVCTEDPGY